MTASTTDIDVALQTMAPPTVRTGSRYIDDSDLADLHPLERATIRNAVAKRQREFATGRALLHQLIGAPGPIPADHRRAPQWPLGFCGSLAHDDRCAVAAVTRDPGIRAIGIDVEPTAPLPAGMAALILRPDERALDAHLVFSLKEAAYKAWSAMGGRFLDHHDVAVTVDGTQFDAHVVTDDVHLPGTFAVVADRTIALVVVRQDGSAGLKSSK